MKKVYRKGVYIKCRTCGKKIYRRFSHSKGDRYCSVLCSQKRPYKKRKTTTSKIWWDIIRNRKGKNNPVWKGDMVGFSGLHMWARNSNIKKSCCEFCGKKDVLLDLSNKQHTYKRNLDDWQTLCRSCHMKYDYKMGFRKDTFKGKRGKKKNEKEIEQVV